MTNTTEETTKDIMAEMISQMMSQMTDQQMAQMKWDQQQKCDQTRLYEIKTPQPEHGDSSCIYADKPWECDQCMEHQYSLGGL